MPKNSARRAQLPEKRLKEPRLQQGTGVWQKPPYLKQRHHLLLHPDLLGTTGSRNASSSPHSAASVTLSLPASPLHRNRLIRAVHFLSLCGRGLRLTTQRFIVTLKEALISSPRAALALCQAHLAMRSSLQDPYAETTICPWPHHDFFFPDANVASSACCYSLRAIAFKSQTSAQGHSQGPPS